MSRVKDKKFLVPARHALKNIGYNSDNTEFNIINNHKIESFDLSKILTSRSTYGIKSVLKSVHLVGLPKIPFSGDDKLNKHCAVYRIPPTIGATALYKLVPRPGSDQPQSKPISAKKVKEELNQWDRLLVVTALGTDEEKELEKKTNLKSQKSTDKTTNDTNGGGSVDLGEYVNSFRDRIAKIPDYQLMACYISKNDGKPHVQLKAGKYDIGLAFVDFDEPIVKNDKLVFKCRTLTPKVFLKTLDTSDFFTKAKSFLGITTTDASKYRASTVVIGEAFKNIAAAMQGSAEAVQILSEIKASKLPVK